MDLLSLSISYSMLFSDRYQHIAMLYTVRLHVDYAALQCSTACLWLVNKVYRTLYTCLSKIAIPAVNEWFSWEPYSCCLI